MSSHFIFWFLRFFTLFSDFLRFSFRDNDPRDKDWHPATDEEIARIESGIRIKLNSIQKIIANKENCRKEDSGFISGYVLGQLVRIGMVYSEHGDTEDYFFSDSKFMGCGESGIRLHYK